jgi:hypothetical protein
MVSYQQLLQQDDDELTTVSDMVDGSASAVFFKTCMMGAANDGRSPQRLPFHPTTVTGRYSAPVCRCVTDSC